MMKEKINLQELTTLLSDKAGITKKEADTFLREFFGLMTEALIEDKLVKIRNLGTFKLSEVEARESVDVRNGKRVVIPAHAKISYTQDKTLSEIINKPYQHLEAKIIEEVPQQHLDAKIVEEVPQQHLDTENIEEIPQQEKAETSVDIPKEKPFVQDGNDLSDETIRQRRKRIRIVLFTFLTIAAMIFIIYFVTKENIDTINPQTRTATAFGNTGELEEGTGGAVNSVDTITPVKEKWGPVKKRKTKTADRLTMISYEEYGSTVFWGYIYEENKHLIGTDNYVKVGIEITIPSPEKYGIDAKDSKSVQRARDFNEKLQR